MGDEYEDYGDYDDYGDYEDSDKGNEIEEGKVDLGPLSLSKKVRSENNLGLFFVEIDGLCHNQ